MPTGSGKERVNAGPGPELTSRLGYLFKHAWLRLTELTGAALTPYGIDGRELAVLLFVDRTEPGSQQQVARRLGVDRTSMVTLLDGLEGKGLVARHPDADDRRKNVVELTEAGRRTLAAATWASEEAERQFLAPLSPPADKQLREALRLLATPPGRESKQ